MSGKANDSSACTLGAPAEDATAPPLARVLLLGPRAWKSRWARLVGTVKHGEIIERIQADAGFGANYAFMVAIAAGIATIGLLLNSPAVIIGAMLISPLMGPIVSAGFSVAGFDVDLGKRSSRTLLLGALSAVGVAATIVELSPVRELTAEILSRTRPNLLDLAIAILSGAAGGYGMIRGRGGAIVGVAIATALMPPLAVVGYGLATWQLQVARGALLLFVTNMAAIALAVAAVAEWYGFGRGGLRKRFARQAMISLLVLAPLSYPLFYSLKSIAWEGRVHSTVRSVLEAGAKRLPHGQLAQVQVKLGDNDQPLVYAIIVSDQSLAGLEGQLRAELKRALGVPVDLRLTQLLADDPARLANGIETEQREARAATSEQEMTAALRRDVPFPLAAVEIDAGQKSAVLVPGFRTDVGLAAWRDIETTLVRRYSDWHVLLVPPPARLPAITFLPGSSELDADAKARLMLIHWALQRWRVTSVDVWGQPKTTARRERLLATRRVEVVAQWLGEQRISARAMPRIEFPHETRSAHGRPFAAIEILLPSDLDALPLVTPEVR